MNLINALTLTNTFRLKGDFCTNFPDKINDHSLKLLCKVHDILYTRYELLTGNDINLLTIVNIRHSATRLEADEQLFNMVMELTKHDSLALLMFLGIRIFGKKYWRKTL